MGIESLFEPETTDVRALAAQFRSRAGEAEPVIARILIECAEALEEEALKAENPKR